MTDQASAKRRTPLLLISLLVVSTVGIITYYRLSAEQRYESLYRDDPHLTQLPPTALKKTKADKAEVGVTASKVMDAHEVRLKRLQGKREALQRERIAPARAKLEALVARADALLEAKGISTDTPATKPSAAQAKRQEKLTDLAERLGKLPPPAAAKPVAPAARQAAL